MQEVPATEELRLHPQAAAVSTLTSIGSSTGVLDPPLYDHRFRVWQEHGETRTQAGGIEADRERAWIMEGDAGLDEAE